jgi:hypothetical protein
LAGLTSLKRRTVVIPAVSDSWLECVASRLSSICPHGLPEAFLLNGRVLLDDVPISQLRDATLRVQEAGLQGGMPVPDFAAMLKEDLMSEALRLGVQTRREVIKVDGKKHRTWRLKSEVAQECTEAWRRKKTRESMSSVAGSASSAVETDRGQADSAPGSASGAVERTDAQDVPQQVEGYAIGPEIKRKSLLGFWKKEKGPAPIHAAVPHEPSAGPSKHRRFGLRAVLDRKRKATTQAREADKSRKATPLVREATKKRMAAPSALQADKSRKATPLVREADKKRKAAPSALQADKSRKATPLVRKATKKRLAAPSALQAGRKRMATATALKTDRERTAQKRAEPSDLPLSQFLTVHRQAEV